MRIVLVQSTKISVQKTIHLILSVSLELSLPSSLLYSLCSEQKFLELAVICLLQLPSNGIEMCVPPYLAEIALLFRNIPYGEENSTFELCFLQYCPFPVLSLL